MDILGYDDLWLKSSGAFDTASEISGQPELWGKVYNMVINERKEIQQYLDDVLPQVSRIILTGAGTSAFIGLSLQGTFKRNLKRHTDAVPTTDLVTNPEDHFSADETIMMVSFARSGNSPESKAAVDLGNKLSARCYNLIITCDPKGELAKFGSETSNLVLILPPESNDRSLAMTGSYSGMLLCGVLVSRINEVAKLESQVHALCLYGRRILSGYSSKLKEMAGKNFQRVVFLGSGPFFGTATESHLKLQEMTDGNIICKNDSYMGFRHGPKAVTNESTLMVFIFSNKDFTRQYEKDLVRGMKKGKKPLSSIAISEDRITDLNFDLMISICDPGAEKCLDQDLLPVCFILPGQLLGFYKSLALGLKPDNPSVTGAISRVVEDVHIYNYSI
ncbi:MAG TPA: SIS domain-containing protein [Bacteroidales bacterium]|jgi:tagatose-6-phosphate ketose/aldose isomerase|nr:SIS domain-containing protein [Bacteroidales bacterium]